MPKSLLLVIPSSTYRTAAFMQAASDIGLEIVVAANQRQAMASLVPDTTIAVNFRDPEDIARKAAILEQRQFDAIMGVDDQSVEVAAQIAEVLNLPHISAASARAARNKLLMRKKLENSGLNTPEFESYSIKKNPQKLAKKQTYPCVIKPIHLSASRGVTRVDNAEEFVAAFERIKELLTQDDVRGLSKNDESDQLLIETFIPGVEVAVEGIMTKTGLKTLAIFDKPDPLDGPYFVESLYTTPSRLPAYVQREVIHAAQEAAYALGIHRGPIHAELRLNENGAWPIEIAARSIGGHCSRMLKFEPNITLEQLILSDAIGEDISEVQRERNAAGVMMLNSPEAGTLLAVNGERAAKNTDYIEDVVITVPLGQSVEPMPWGGRYLGFIFAGAAHPEEVESALRSATAQLDFVVSANN